MKDGKFKNSKFGQFLSKAKDVIVDNGGDIIDIGLAAATGNPAAVISETMDLFRKDDSPKAKALLGELERERQNFELEMYQLEIKDRDSARTREIEVAKTGKADVMMYATGGTGLATFILMVLAAIYMPEQQENKLFVHLMGIIEGVALTIFAYYFGTSKGSKDKQATLDKLKI